MVFFGINDKIDYFNILLTKKIIQDLELTEFKEQEERIRKYRKVYCFLLKINNDEKMIKFKINCLLIINNWLHPIYFKNKIYENSVEKIELLKGIQNLCLLYYENKEIKNYNKYAEIIQMEDINYGIFKEQFPIQKFLKNKILQRPKIQKSHINLIKDFLGVIFILFNSLIIFINIK